MKQLLYISLILLINLLTTACNKKSSCNKNLDTILPLVLANSLEDSRPYYHGIQTWITGAYATNPNPNDYTRVIDHHGIDVSRQSHLNGNTDCPVVYTSDTDRAYDEESVATEASPVHSPVPSSDSGASTSYSYPSPYPYPGIPNPGYSQAGVLTAGSFSDAKNFSYFLNYWNSQTQNEVPWQSIEPLYDGSHPQNEFPWATIESADIGSRLGGASKTSVDLVFVLDATGSMADELEYLKKEIEYISVSIRSSFPNVTQRFSLIVYRDQGEQYMTKGNYFTEDLSAFIDFISTQSASGGGDYPEAMHAPLHEAVNRLDWGGENTAKVLFLIADAPPHQKHLASTIYSINELKKLGVHIYPVAASGVAAKSEKVMRYAALVTGGEYLFITDDSGVGNPHAEPHIPCYSVAHLNELMILKVSEEISQTSINLNSQKIIRTVGSEATPGVCTVLNYQANSDSSN